MDVMRRLEEHNAGRVRSTKSYIPWEVIHVEEVPTRGEAMRREKGYKSPAGRKKVKEILKVKKLIEN